MRVPKMALTTLFVLTLFLFAPLSFAQQQLSSPAPSSTQQTQRAWLGIAIQEVNENVARHMGVPPAKGLIIVDVVPNGPADGAGMRQGDVIVKFNGREITDSKDFISMVQEAGVGAVVVLGVGRAGAVNEVKVTLEPMPMAAMPGTGHDMGMGQGMGYMGGGECPSHGQSVEKPCPMGRDCPMGDECPVKAGKYCQQCQAGMKGSGYGQMGWGKMGRGHHYRSMGQGMGAGMRHGGTYSPMYGKIMMAIKGMDLTPEQRSKTAAIRSEYRKKAVKAAADAKIAHMELHEMIAADPVNLEKVRSKVNELSRKKADMMMSGIKALEDLKKVLTPAQRKSLRDTLYMDSSDTEEDMDGSEAREGAE